MGGPSLAGYWRDSTTPSEFAISHLIKGEGTVYSVIMVDLQYQRDNGVDPLVRIAPEAGPEIDLTDDPLHRARLDRGRAILDSVLGVGSPQAAR